MQAKKELVAGRLYIQTMYPAGMLPGMRPAGRRQRMRVTSEAKRAINRLNREYGLVALFELNFRCGRDIFAELGFREEPPDRKAEQRALERFHRRMKKYMKARGRGYKYILVRETHNRDGAPVRVHYHLVCSGTGQRMREAVAAAWDAGDVDVRTLRDFGNSFEDTVRYLLKERKEDGERAYRTSRNLKRPDEPLRRKAPESQMGEVPPGVEPLRVSIHADNPFGRYSIIIGRIADPAAFGRYWAKAKLDRRHSEEDANWRRYARKKKMENRGSGEGPLSGSKTRLTFPQGSSEKCGR